MQTVEDPPIETVHIYVVREKEKRPPTLLPLLGAFLCLVGIAVLTVYSAYHPYYEYERLTIPAHFFIRAYSATAQIIPTGVKIYPATTAHGILTLTNGSVVSQTFPQGIIFTGKDGIEVVTDTSVFVPAGSASGYGVAIVQAKAVVSGVRGNISALSINAVYGTSLYVRNLDNFTGGKDAYLVKVVTAQDKQNALDAARAILATQQAQIKAFLAYPCKETAFLSNHTVALSWACQYVTFSIPSSMHITSIKLVGNTLLVDVVFVPKPRRIWVK